jgi:hypothetical protein
VSDRLAENKRIAACKHTAGCAGDLERIEVVRAVSMTKQLADNLAGTVGRQHLKRAAGVARQRGEQVVGVDDAVGELQDLQIREVIAAVPARDPVMHHHLAIGNREVVIADVAGELDRIDPVPAVNAVVAGAAGENVVARAAIDHIDVGRCTGKPVLDWMQKTPTARAGVL